MFELILLFTIVVLVTLHELGTFKKPNDPCTMHTWSKDLNDQRLVCTNCNFKV